MKYIYYQTLEQDWFNKCFPDNDNINDSQRKIYLSFFSEALYEIWNKFDWAFAVDVEQVTVIDNSIFINSIENSDCRILQILDGNPDTARKPNNITFRIRNDKIYLPFLSANIKTVFIKYKRNTPLVTPVMTLPEMFKNMILALCTAHWEASQARPDNAKFNLENFERYFAMEVAKQTIFTNVNNNINQRKYEIVRQ